MKNPVILVNCCKKNRDLGCLNAIRESWASRAEVPFMFFLGQGCDPFYGAFDETILDVKDDYHGQSWKNREAIRWGLKQGFTNFFVCCDDTYIDTHKLQLNVPEGDYVGNCKGTPKPGAVDGVPYDYCHGGPGYWISERAARLIVAAEINTDKNINHRLCDQWIGEVLYKNGILPVHDSRYSMGKSYGFKEQPVLNRNENISCHLSLGPGDYDPEWMREADRTRLGVLVAVNSCWKDKSNGSNQAIRDTWGKNLPPGWDLRFFLGGKTMTDEEQRQMMTPQFMGSPGTLGVVHPTTAAKNVIGSIDTLLPDEIFLENSGDGYLELPWKTVESLRWGLNQGYDFIVRAFTDTYLFPHVMAKSDIWKWDASGANFGCPPCPAHPTLTHWCPLGGNGYTTSRKASQAIVDEPIKHWGEDTHVGFALRNAGIELHDDDRYRWDIATLASWNRIKFSIHMNDRGKKWNPAMMIAKHQEIKDDKLKDLFPAWDGKCTTCGHVRFRPGPYGPRCRHCGSHYAAYPKKTATPTADRF